MKTGILFDLDGTLLSTLEDLTDAVNYTLRHYGCPERSREEVCSFLGYGAKYLITSALPEKGKDFDVDTVLAFYQKYYGAHSQIKTRPYDGILEALDKQDIYKVASSMGNVLETVTIGDYPIIEEIKDVMKEEGALNAMMSGSGPTVFGIFDDKSKARQAQDRVRKLQIAKQVYIANVHNVRRK